MPLYSNKLNEAIRDKAKQYLPTWLADTLAPEKPDPVDVINPLAMGAGLMGPLISIYKPASFATKAERVAAREFGNANFLETMKNFVGGNTESNVYKAAELFNKHYPRAAAHIETIPKGLVKSPTPSTAAYIDMEHGGNELTEAVKAPLGLGISKMAKYTYEMPQNMPRAIGSIFHEGTHVAQKLMNKEVPRLYALFNKLSGYHGVPYERSAEATASRWERLGQRLGSNVRKTSATREGQKILESPQAQRSIMSRHYSNTIKKILEERAKRGWHPNPDFVPEGGWEKYFPGYVGKP